MKKLIRKILREHKSDRHYRILDKISEHVQLPYFKSMEGLTIYDEDDQEYIMRKIYDNDIYIRRKYIADDNLKIIYIEKSDGDWVKREYDDKGNLIYSENSDGHWDKYGYDGKGNNIYYEDSSGYWEEWKYD